MNKLKEIEKEIEAMYQHALKSAEFVAPRSEREKDIWQAKALAYRVALAVIRNREEK